MRDLIIRNDGTIDVLITSDEINHLRQESNDLDLRVNLSDIIKACCNCNHKDYVTGSSALTKQSDGVYICSICGSKLINQPAISELCNINK